MNQWSAFSYVSKDSNGKLRKQSEHAPFTLEEDSCNGWYECCAEEIHCKMNKTNATFLKLLTSFFIRSYDLLSASMRALLKILSPEPDPSGQYLHFMLPTREENLYLQNVLFTL